MDRQTFEQKINEIVNEIGCIQGHNSKKTVVSDENSDVQKQFSNKAKDLRDSLDSLRVSIKYLLFDLEATYRENAYLRQLLDEREEQD